MAKRCKCATARKGNKGILTYPCLLYTSDAADERSSVDLGGRRIIKKNIKKQRKQTKTTITHNYNRTLTQKTKHTRLQYVTLDSQKMPRKK